MKLYHGTTEAAAKVILGTALLPRDKVAGNWKHATGRADCVHLTHAYPLTFALNAQARLPISFWKRVRCAVLEVDTTLLNPWRMGPDEDTLEEIGRAGVDNLPPDMSPKDRLGFYRDRLPDFMGPQFTADALTARGTCVHHGGIATHAITRVSFIDPFASPGIAAVAGSAVVTVAEHVEHGSLHRQLTARIMHDAGEATAEEESRLTPSDLLRIDAEVIERPPAGWGAVL